MIWTKNRSSVVDWMVWHKDLNGGGAAAAPYNLRLNGDDAQSSNGDIYGGANNVLPTSTHWTTGGNNGINESGSKFIAMLFASVDGVSSVGAYDGSASNVTVTTGFTPRFIIIKKNNGTSNWSVFDTERGLGASGDDQLIKLNSDAAQGAANTDYVNTTATGFVVNAGQSGETNGSASDKYIYYAHA